MRFRADRFRTALAAVAGTAVSLALLAVPAQADPATISGAIQFPAGITPPFIEPDFPDIAVFDNGTDEIHYEVFGDHADLSGFDASLSWDVDSSQLRWTLVNPPETTYRFSVYWSRWVYTGPIPDQVDSKQFWLSSSSTSLQTLKAQATTYPVGTSSLFHCAYGFEGCASGGGGTTPAVTPGTPTVSGRAQVGERLAVAPGTWAPADTALAYLWLRDGKPIGGATSTTYEVVAADAGKKLSVKVTGARSGYTTQSATSATTAAVAKGELSPKTPKIKGKAKVGKTLTAKAGVWKPSGVKLSFQWYADGKKIPKANDSTFTLSQAVKGKKILVKVTGTKSGYATETKSSAATKKVT